MNGEKWPPLASGHPVRMVKEWRSASVDSRAAGHGLTAVLER